jgi:hypothetical protein
VRVDDRGGRLSEARVSGRSSFRSSCEWAVVFQKLVCVGGRPSEDRESDRRTRAVLDLSYLIAKRTLCCFLTPHTDRKTDRVVFALLRTRGASLCASLHKNRCP